MHVYEVRTYEVRAREVHAHEVHALEMHAHEVHAREMYAHKVHAREMHIYEVHTFFGSHQGFVQSSGSVATRQSWEAAGCRGRQQVVVEGRR
jgi:hypothetical protein